MSTSDNIYDRAYNAVKTVSALLYGALITLRFLTPLVTLAISTGVLGTFGWYFGLALLLTSLSFYHLAHPNLWCRFSFWLVCCLVFIPYVHRPPLTSPTAIWVLVLTSGWPGFWLIITWSLIFSVMAFWTTWVPTFERWTGLSLSAPSVEVNEQDPQ